MRFPRISFLVSTVLFVASVLGSQAWAQRNDSHHGHHHKQVEFSLRSVKDGYWTDPSVWKPARVPQQGDRVLISRDTFVEYDARSQDVIRLVQVVGTLSFSRDRDTLLNVGLLKVQQSQDCSENGFACDFEGVNSQGEPIVSPGRVSAALLVGTPEQPIPAQHKATIRLHHLNGMNKDDAPAIACCSARMEIHGAPLSRTWVKLGADALKGDATVSLSERVEGWRVGDSVIVTSSEKNYPDRTFRNSNAVTTEERAIKAIDGTTITLDQPLEYEHFGSGEFRSEVANLSRNVVIESADPDGVRGHTVFHRYSQGSMSYARLAHLGKENVLGRYAVHFHLAGDTMRGSQLRGLAIVDSHNRWVTIHGTEYLIVRDCVGYQSVGHGFFMEDGTEIYNLLEGNLGVQAYRGKRLPDQVLPFDPNDGAAFWWANGRNTLVGNVACENDEYGFRYDMQHSKYFNAHLPITQPDGSTEEMDVRTIGIWRFDNNESHSEGVYGLVIAANGNSQPDNAVRDEEKLAYLRDRIDWTAPDTRHPHTVRNMKIWEVHYGFRAQSPSLLAENIRIANAAYGIYRPAFDNHVYRNLHISHVDAEPFNRGMDDASTQQGVVTVDGLTFESDYGNKTTPLVQISDNNLSGSAATHIRNLQLNRPEKYRDRWPVVNRGVGTQAPPVTEQGVPIYLHDHFGPGRHAKVVSTLAKAELADGNRYEPLPPYTGDQALAAEVTDVDFPELLHPTDDLPPATVITSIRRTNGQLLVTGTSHDNGEITTVTVNDKPARMTRSVAGVVDWEATLSVPANKTLTAHATDAAGNEEQTRHRVSLGNNANARTSQPATDPNDLASLWTSFGRWTTILRAESVLQAQPPSNSVRPSQMSQVVVCVEVRELFQHSNFAVRYVRLPYSGDHDNNGNSKWRSLLDTAYTGR